MTSEREYYIAGGEDLTRALAFIEERKAAIKAMAEVADKFGGKAVHQGGMIAGLVLDEQPAGWTKKGSVDGKPYYFPKRINKALREAAAELRSVRLLGAQHFHGLFSKEGGVFGTDDPHGGIRILYIVWEWVGDTLLLSVPAGSDFQPNGSTPLKMSEYWTMKEAADKANSTIAEA